MGGKVRCRYSSTKDSGINIRRWPATLTALITPRRTFRRIVSGDWFQRWDNSLVDKYDGLTLNLVPSIKVARHVASHHIRVPIELRTRSSHCVTSTRSGLRDRAIEILSH